MEKHYEIKKTINKVIREKGRFPSLQEMCNILHYTEDQTRKYMQALADDGYLEKVKDWYKYPEKEIKSETDAKKPIFVAESEHPTSKIEIYEENETGQTATMNEFLSKNPFKILKYPKNKKLKRKSTKYSAPIYIIQLLMGIIGIGASVISIYYTTVWLLEFLPWAFALLLSSIMVGFAVSAFETVILFLSGQVTRSRIAQWSITLGFIILWISVTFFSIFSTIAGQYNKFVLNLQDKAKQGMDTGKMNWESLQEQKQDLRMRLNEYRENVKTYTEISKTMQGLEKRIENEKTWAENQYRLRKANEEIRTILTELNKARNEEQILLKESKDKGIILGITADTEDIVNFYGWIAKIFDIDKNKAQFFMSLLPAVFVDIISPAAIALALFLRNKYKV